MNLDGDTFTVTIASSGECFEIPPDRSILDVLREAGIYVMACCRSGTCGACEVAVLDGLPDHHDFVLRGDEQTRKMMVCVSRSKSKRLVIDL